jgi:hypothetical protein
LAGPGPSGRSSTEWLRQSANTILVQIPPWCPGYNYEYSAVEQHVAI